MKITSRARHSAVCYRTAKQGTAAHLNKPESLTTRKLKNPTSRFRSWLSAAGGFGKQLLRVSGHWGQRVETLKVAVGRFGRWWMRSSWSARRPRARRHARGVAAEGPREGARPHVVPATLGLLVGGCRSGARGVDIIPPRARGLNTVQTVPAWNFCSRCNSHFVVGLCQAWRVACEKKGLRPLAAASWLCLPSSAWLPWSL